MKIIAFEEREVTLRKAVGSFPAINKTCTELSIIDLIDTGIDVRALMSIDNVQFSRILCNRINYKPLKDWTELEINNKIMDLL